MTTVCQKCGVRGYANLLIFCEKCQISAEHRYCLDDGPKLVEEVHWLCEQCVPRVHKVDAPHTINLRQRKKCAMRCHDRKSRHADLLKRIKDPQLQENFIAKPSMNVDKPQNGASHCSKKDVLNVATMLKEPKSVGNSQGDLLLPSERNGVLPGRENGECLGTEVEGSFGNEVKGRQMKRKRKLILYDDSDEDAPFSMPIDIFTDGVPYRSATESNKLHLPSQQNHSFGTAQPNKSLTEPAAESYSYFPVSPIVHPVWRGCFNICDRKYGSVVAHLSNMACEKVCNMAEMLPPVIHFERLPRLQTWPKSFKCSTPTDDNIALYFFPGDDRATTILEQLLDDVIKKDLALKVAVHNAELLVFSSMLLPQRCRLFEGEHYLWGVFRGRQDSGLPMPPDTYLPKPNDAAAPVDGRQQCKVSEDASTQCLNVGVGGNDDDGNALNEPQTLGGQVPDISGGLKPPVRQVPEQCLSRLNKVMEDNVGEGKDALLRGGASGPPPRLPLEPSGFIEVATEPAVKALDGDVEFNFRGEYEGIVGGSLAATCLELFPLGAEDLGITAKVPGGHEVDLELGLETVKDRKCECKPALREPPPPMLFGRAIF